MSPHWRCRFVAALLLLVFAAGACADHSCPANCLGGRAKNSSSRARRCRSRAAPVVSLPSTVAPEGAEKLMVVDPRLPHHRQHHLQRRGSRAAVPRHRRPRSPGHRRSTISRSASPRNTARDGYVLSRAIVPPQELEPARRRSCASRSSKAISTRSSGRRAVEVPRLLLGLCREDHRRAADQRQDARALPAAGERPSRPEVQEQPEGLADQAGRRDAGGRGGGEAARRIRPRRQPRHQGARPAAVFHQHQPQQSRPRARNPGRSATPARSSSPSCNTGCAQLPAGAHQRRA